MKAGEDASCVSFAPAAAMMAFLLSTKVSPLPRFLL